jgi:CRISPR-associated endoribonuclease Cas6
LKRGTVNVRFVVEFIPESEEMQLPLAYNSLIQGVIYHNLEKPLADRVHDEGTPFGRRPFRFFTFSKLLGRYQITGTRIGFRGPVKLHVGSVHEEVLQSLAEHLLKNPRIQLGRSTCEIRSIEVETLPKLSGPVKVHALSPITTYSTLATADGRKKTYYFSPFEKEWEEKLLANLKRKAQALGWGEGRLAGLEEAHIRPVRVDKRNLRIMRYRDTVIKAWSGIYELDLPEPFFLLAYDSGLGSKNPQGFGMVEVMKASTRKEG